MLGCAVEEIDKTPRDVFCISFKRVVIEKRKQIRPDTGQGLLNSIVARIIRGRTAESYLTLVLVPIGGMESNMGAREPSSRICMDD